MSATWCARPDGCIVCPEMSGAERPAAVVTRARVLAVDDDASFLSVLRALVRATAHLELAGEACSGETAIAAARRLGPDMVLMDVRMPGIGGMKAAERIKADRRSTLIVLISTTHPDEIPRRACGGFACAVLWKSTLEPRGLDDLWLRHRDRPSG
jgi:DNA-binding NarL/FixJ family response regulator